MQKKSNRKKLKHIPLKCKTQKQEEEECKEIRKRENGEETNGNGMGGKSNPWIPFIYQWKGFSSSLMAMGSALIREWGLCFREKNQ